MKERQAPIRGGRIGWRVCVAGVVLLGLFAVRAVITPASRGHPGELHPLSASASCCSSWVRCWSLPGFATLLGAPGSCRSSEPRASCRRHPQYRSDPRHWPPSRLRGRVGRTRHRPTAYGAPGWGGKRGVGSGL